MADKTVQQRFGAKRKERYSCETWRFNSFRARANNTEFTLASGTGAVNKETLSSDWLWRGNDCLYAIDIGFPSFFFVIAYHLIFVHFIFHFHCGFASTKFFFPPIERSCRVPLNCVGTQSTVPSIEKRLVYLI